MTERQNSGNMTASKILSGIGQKRGATFSETVERSIPSVTKDPKIKLSVKLISKMAQVSQQQKWHTFVVAAWSVNPAYMPQMCIPQSEVDNGITAISSSPLTEEMYTITLDYLERYDETPEEEKGAFKLPHRINVRNKYLERRVREYRELKAEDGLPYAHKTIAKLLSEKLGIRVTKQLIDHISSSVIAENPEKRKLPTHEELMELAQRVKVLRNRTGRKMTVGEIARKLKKSINTVKTAIEYLLKEGSIEKRPPSMESANKPKLFKIFKDFAHQHPDQRINFSAIAKELGINRKTVVRHFNEFEVKKKDTPKRNIKGGRFKPEEILVYSSLIKLK